MAYTKKADKLHLDRIERFITQYETDCRVMERPVLKFELQAFLDRELSRKQPQQITFHGDYQKMMADYRKARKAAWPLLEIPERS